jgi:hypothetical protein
VTQRIYTSAIQRLADLPEVFTGGDLTVLLGWKSAICSSYLAQWRKAGLVKSLGGRSDVHMNLVRNRQVSPEAALRRAYPQVVKVGVDVLREAGWTTQIATRIDVAVPTASSLYALPGFAITTRTAPWFQCVAPGTEIVQHGINRLQPAWALADMLARAQDRRVRSAWLPDPEDLDLQSVRSHKHTERALQAFGLDIASISDAGYEELYSSHQQARRSADSKSR